MNRVRSRGFTLTEVMISVVLSIMVFAALGMLLTRCFSLWVDGQANWNLAQHARVTRSRLLNGAFGVGTGVINGSNVTVQAGTDEWEGWQSVRFELVDQAEYYQIYASPGANQMNICIEKEGEPEVALAQEVRYRSGGDPLVKVNNFGASVTNKHLTMTYTLNFSAMGKNFELPQIIEAYLVNN